jgi:hypothetical protein
MKRVILSLVTVALLAQGVAYAKSSKEVSKDALTSAKVNAQTKEAHVIKEAVEAVALTQKVLIDLDKKDTTKAKSDLESAIGKLEVALSAKHSPKLLPIDATVKATEYLGSVKDVKAGIDTTIDLLKDHKVQEARAIINALVSEIDVVSVNLPVATYPQALKLAASYLHEGKVDQAKEVLVTALSTLVEDVVVIPIPIVKATALIDTASKIAKKDKDQALKHLDLAKEELEKAELLGYTSKSDVTYKSLYDQIKKVKKEIKGKNKAEKLFEELVNKLKSFKDKM